MHWRIHKGTLLEFPFWKIFVQNVVYIFNISDMLNHNFDSKYKNIF